MNLPHLLQTCCSGAQGEASWGCWSRSLVCWTVSSWSVSHPNIFQVSKNNIFFSWSFILLDVRSWPYSAQKMLPGRRFLIRTPSGISLSWCDLLAEGESRSSASGNSGSYPVRFSEIWSHWYCHYGLWRSIFVNFNELKWILRMMMKNGKWYSRSHW